MIKLNNKTILIKIYDIILSGGFMEENNKNTLMLDDFVLLMLVNLAKKSDVTFNDDKCKMACLPAYYKQIIENILCADNGWKEKFSNLIDINKYFIDHFMWEMELSYSFCNVLSTLNKKVSYEFTNDYIMIPFFQEEIDKIMSKYTDVEIVANMEHFVSLLTDYIYTREFQEQIYDYTARSVKKMRKISDRNILGDAFHNYVNISLEYQRMQDIPVVNVKKYFSVEQEEKDNNRAIKTLKKYIKKK